MAHNPDIKYRQRRKRHDLQHRVESHKQSAVLFITLCKIGPYQHHGDTARDADEDEALAKFGSIGEESLGEDQHQQRGDDLVYDCAEEDLEPEFAKSEQNGEGLVAHFDEHGVHHY